MAALDSPGARAAVAPREALAPGERRRGWGTRFRLRERMAQSLVVVPSLYMAGALALAELVPRVEGSGDVLRLRIDADTARTILSAVASGMIAFTGVVVSLAVLVVQFGASQYTPRLVQRFRRDPLVRHSLGIFIAPAVYALVSLRVIGQNGRAIVPSVTLGLNFALLLVAVLVFFLLVGRCLDLLRPRRVIAQMVDQGSAAIGEVFPFAHGDAPSIPVDVLTDAVVVARHEGRPAVVAALDHGRLVRAAAAADVVLEVAAGVGEYVQPGAPLLLVYGSAALDPAELRRAVILAEERTIAQDPAFAIRAIVDIALRALSPAVNDPTTAVQAIDGLETLLGELAGRDLLRGRVADADGRLRLVYPTADWASLLDLAVTEIRVCGVDSPQVARRLRALLLGLAASAPSRRQEAIDAQLNRLDAAVAAAYPDPVERRHAQTADRLGIGGTRAGGDEQDALDAQRAASTLAG